MGTSVDIWALLGEIYGALRGLEGPHGSSGKGGIRAAFARLAGPGEPPAEVAALRMRILTAMEGLVTLGRVEAVVELTPLALRIDPVVAEGAASAVDRLLTGLEPGALPGLDAFARCVRTYDGGGWDALTPETLPLLAAHDPGGAALCRVASLHRSGFVRGAAVGRLGAGEDGRALPFLLLRLNDWVPAVALAAEEALGGFEHPRWGDAWVRALPMVEHLRGVGRRDLGPRVGEIFAMLRAPGFRDALHRGLDSEERVVRLRCHRLLGEAEPEGLGARLGAALGDADPVIRRWALGAVPQVKQRAERIALYEAALRDPIGRHRCAALEGLAEEDGDRGEALSRRALLDKSPAVRSAARAHLKARDPAFDGAAFYRARLVEGDGWTQRRALLGLMETGDASDDGRISPALRHPSPGMRGAAVLALAALTGDTHVPDFRRLLEDPAEGVSRRARDALHPHVHRLDAPSLEALTLGDAPLDVRRGALALLNRRAKWARLSSLLRVARTPDPALALGVDAALDRWLRRYNKSFVAPEASELRDIRAALKAGEGAFAEAWVSEIRDIVAGFPGG